MNSIDKQRPFQTSSFLPPLIAALCILFIQTGCILSTQSYPPGTGFVRSMEVENIFMEKKLLPDHDYYFTGSENDPDAILAVRKDIKFTKGLWSAINLTQEKLNFWITFIDNDTRRWNCDWYGKYVIDPSGRKVALYFSKYDYTVVKFPEPGALVVYPPDALTGNSGLLFNNCYDDEF